jgi:hypothetical protein
VILTDHHHQSFYREKEPEEEKMIKEKKMGSKLPTYTYLFNFFSSNAAIGIFVTPANRQPIKAYARIKPKVVKRT